MSGLLPQFDGYKLLQLTDLHISRLFPKDWTQALVERSSALGVDLIVVTGDLIDGSFDARRADVEPLRSLYARDGVWVIPGNHEYIFGYEAWMRHYASLGMRVLSNDHTVLTRKGGSLVLAGLTGLSAPGTRHRICPPRLRMRRQTLRSCCSTTSRGTLRRRPHAVWRCNCPGIPMAA